MTAVVNFNLIRIILYQGSRAIEFRLPQSFTFNEIKAKTYIPKYSRKAKFESFFKNIRYSDTSRILII